MLSAPDQFALFIYYNATRSPAGFAQASVRHDYVNGTSTSPVVFLEGIYVEPSFRRAGLARQLVAAVARWAGNLHLSELASDADINNEGSLAMHASLGFEEAERVVFFRRAVGEENDA